MLLLYIMRKIETPASFHLATLAICFMLFSLRVQAQDAPMNAPEVMPVLNSCALIEDRTERETCSNQGIMEHIINKLEYPEAAQNAGIEGTVVVKFVINKTGQVDKTLVLKGPKNSPRLRNSGPLVARVHPWLAQRETRECRAGFAHSFRPF